MASVLARVRYGKLVRDRIPEIIERTGKAPTCRELSDEEFRLALRAKAVEEAGELVEAPDEEVLSELADLAEVIEWVLRAYSFSPEDLNRARRKKNEERGGFEKRILLESVSD
jgi:predicted house-cleaning noncanonical NTP pyrophosphatase (MazG superfamily)